MLARIRKSMEERDEGFTLIELLVVMIIIGILSAIAIPVFLSQRAKARDSAVKADVSTVGKEIATYYVDNTTAPTVAIDGGAYELNGESIGRVSDGVGTLVTEFTSSTEWCVSLTHPQGDVGTFSYSAANGLSTNGCS